MRHQVAQRQGLGCGRLYRRRRAGEDFASIEKRALKTGASKGHVISPADRDRMLDEYYRLRGWDAQGVPTPERLAALGLEALAADLPPRA